MSHLLSLLQYKGVKVFSGSSKFMKTFNREIRYENESLG